MTNPTLDPALLPNLLRAAAAAGRLAENETLFRAGIDAVRARNRESFQRLLAQLQIGGDCELLCRWICVKESVLRCIVLCGPEPPPAVSVADIPRFAEVVAAIARDPGLAGRLANAVQQQDAAAYMRLVAELKIERFCHLLCHWVSIILCRLSCEVVCAPRLVPVRHLVEELQLAGGGIGALLRDRAVLDQIIKAGVAADCETLSGLLTPGGNCVVICEWICSWHCVLICLRLCAGAPPIRQAGIEEMREFAQAMARAASLPHALPRLVEAVHTANVEAFAALLKELQLERFCVQLCEWVCFEICRLFCFCVCPPPVVTPLFTKVGVYRVDPIWNDFTADGTTTAGHLAFTSTIPLNGLLPNGDSPTALKYRFLTQKYPLGPPPTPVTPAMIPPTIIGTLEYHYWDKIGLQSVLASANYWANNPDPSTNTVTIPQQFGPDLVVSVNKTVAPDGWIEVPRENNSALGSSGLFVGGNVTLANLDTTTLTNEVFDLTVNVSPLPLQAGAPVPAAQQSEKPTFKITFEARDLLNNPVSTNDREKIALSNTRYTYVRHPDWAGGPITTTPVVSLDIAELKAGGGCNPVSGHIHALFTAYHPYLGTCVVFIQGPGVPPPAAVNPAISAAGMANSPAGGHEFDITTLKPCAYILWVSTTLNLTTGFGKLPGEFDDLIAFCTH